jgi:aryl-alcohol dehydrogenase-like predicted oxidoreductase
MEQRKVGNSDLELPVVTFGAWAIGGLFWGGNEDQEAIEAIEAALDHGIDAIDTAPAYGCGHSEELVGRAVARRRNEVKLLTKCGLRWEENSGDPYFTLAETPYGRPVSMYKNVTAASIVEECENSLKRLGTDYIDLYQVHWPSKTASAEETVAALNKLREQGKIRHFGVSNYSSGQLHEARKHGPVISNQIRYNLLERGIEKDELPYCRKHEVGVICYSPMAMGLLTGRVTEGRTFPATDIRSSNPLFSPTSRKKVLQALQSISALAADHGTGFAQLSVAWVLGQPGITTALVGARNARQVKENVGAAEVRLSEEELQTIRKVFEELGDLRKPVQV